MALDWLWWRAWVSVGRRRRCGSLRVAGVTWRPPPSLCVAGVALGDLGRHFAWQAWHLWHWTGSGGALGSPLGAAVAAAVGVAGVALGDIHLYFAWQAWHLVTFTFTLRGRRGTWRHGPPLCVAVVALGDIHLRVAWQAWHLVTSTFVLHGRRGTYGTGLALVSHAILVTHHLSHTTFSHTIFHTPSLTHPLSRPFRTPSLSHNIFHTLSFTHPLSHPTLSHTIFDTPSFTHHIVTHHL